MRKATPDPQNDGDFVLKQLCPRHRAKRLGLLVGRDNFFSGLCELVIKTGRGQSGVPWLSDCSWQNGSGEVMLTEEKLENLF